MQEAEKPRVVNSSSCYLNLIPLAETRPVAYDLLS